MFIENEIFQCLYLDIKYFKLFGALEEVGFHYVMIRDVARNFQKIHTNFIA